MEERTRIVAKKIFLKPSGRRRKIKTKQRHDDTADLKEKVYAFLTRCLVRTREAKTKTVRRAAILESIENWLGFQPNIAKLYEQSMAKTSERLHDLLVRLETLKNIEPKDKLAVTADGKFVLHQPGIVTSVVRTLGFDGRLETIRIIRETMDDALEQLKASAATKETELTHGFLLVGISSACGGVWKLRETYEGDRRFLSEVTVLLNRVKGELVKQGAPPELVADFDISEDAAKEAAEAVEEIKAEDERKKRESVREEKES